MDICSLKPDQKMFSYETHMERGMCDGIRGIEQIFLFLTLCSYCVQKKSIKGVLLHLNKNRHPNGMDENPHLV